MEEVVYKLIQALDFDEMDGLGFSVHDITSESYGIDGKSYRVYTSDGNAFEVTCEQVDDDGGMYVSFYSLDGFKPLTCMEAMVYLQKNGVFQ